MMIATEGSARVMLEGKVALVTGAGRGIGRATAELFARNGAVVLLNDLDGGVLAEAEEAIKAAGRRALSFACDLTSERAPEDLVAFVERAGGRLDVLINNAGVALDAVIHKATDDQWDRTLQLHLATPFRLIRALGTRYMRDVAKGEAERGATSPSRKIVNVSSIAGVMGNPGQISYSAAKAGVVGLTKTAAREWGRFNVNVNAVAFGAIETRMTAERRAGVQGGMPKEAREEILRQTPLGRMGTPSDAANAILFLASPMADFVSGHVLIVSGGWYT
jgi:3-oxoacyl-[acyl-carrier protein] reductase